MATDAKGSSSLEEAVVPDSLEAEAYRAIYPEQFFRKFLEGGLRPDGRETNEWRESVVGANAISHADGSCLVKLGYTSVLARITLEVEVPGLDRPDRGKIEWNVVLAAVSAPEVHPGKPSNKARRIALDLSTTLEACDAVDLKQLCIVVGQAAWTIHLDVYCLEDDGSVFDAALMASLGALLLTELPAMQIHDGGVSYFKNEDNMQEDDGRSVTMRRPLDVQDLPLSVTLGFYRGYKLYDPTHEEEGLLQSSATVSINREGKVVFFRVPGGSIELEEEDVLNCIAVARERYQELYALLEEELGLELLARSKRTN